MGKVLAVVNQKGGVGKTTTSVNLSASLASLDCRVLLIDLDAQGNATMGSGVDKHDLRSTVNDVLLDEADITQTMISVKAGYDVLPANRELTVAEVNLLQVTRKEFRLRQALQKVRDQYDFVVIDCPPSLSMLTVNALAAADGVIITMQCEYYALEGLTSLLETVTQLQASINPKLKIEGILRAMYDGRSRLTADVSEQLFTHFGDKVYQTCIPRNVRLAEAPSYGMPALLYDKKSPGAEAYLFLASEILERQEHEYEALKAQAAEEAIA